MSDNPNLNAFQTDGTWTYAGSANAGAWEARQGYTPSPQQSTESAISYETRMNAYQVNQQ